MTEVPGDWYETGRSNSESETFPGQGRRVTTTTTISLRRDIDKYVDGVYTSTRYEYDTKYETFVRDYVWVSTGWVMSSSSGSDGNLWGSEWEQYQRDLGNYSIYQATGKQPASSLVQSVSSAAGSLAKAADSFFGFSHTADTFSAWRSGNASLTDVALAAGATALKVGAVVAVGVAIGAVAGACGAATATIALYGAGFGALTGAAGYTATYAGKRLAGKEATFSVGDLLLNMGGGAVLGAAAPVLASPSWGSECRTVRGWAGGQRSPCI